jgi:hypothetical protein
MNRMKHVAPKRVPSGLPVNDGGHHPHDCDFGDYAEDDDY